MDGWQVVTFHRDGQEVWRGLHHKPLRFRRLVNGWPRFHLLRLWRR